MALKVYIARLREQIAKALREGGSVLAAENALISETTDSNLVVYRINVAVEILHRTAKLMGPRRSTTSVTSSHDGDTRYNFLGFAQLACLLILIRRLRDGFEAFPTVPSNSEQPLLHSENSRFRIPVRHCIPIPCLDIYRDALIS